MFPLDTLHKNTLKSSLDNSPEKLLLTSELENYS